LAELLVQDMEIDAQGFVIPVFDNPVAQFHIAWVEDDASRIAMGEAAAFFLLKIVFSPECGRQIRRRRR
jgi:hypothetical protein